jgi:hypothetical protein
MAEIILLFSSLSRTVPLFRMDPSGFSIESSALANRSSDGSHSGDSYVISIRKSKSDRSNSSLVSFLVGKYDVMPCSIKGIRSAGDRPAVYDHQTQSCNGHVA